MATKKRLIDANALIAYFEQQCDLAAKDTQKESVYVLAALKCCIDFFRNFPTVDTMEEVHGRWEDVYGGKYQNKRYRCTVCKEKALFKFRQDELLSWHEEQKLSNYCPNCGAKMDGEGNG